MSSERLAFKVHGMDCAEEVTLLRQELSPLVGGDANLAFDILSRKMIVTAPPGVTAGAVMRAVAQTPMKAEPWREEGPSLRREGTFWQLQGRTLTTALSAMFTAVGFVAHAVIAGGISRALGSEGLGIAHGVPAIAKITYAVAIIAGAWFVAPRAVFALRRLRPDMNLLMTIAVLGAVGIGEWFEAATVSFLFALSLALESWSVSRARRAVAALMDLAPDKVRLLEPQGEREVAPDQVSVGAMFVVRPGERVPLDGVVRRGSSEINQAPITGESVPVAKAPGDAVFAGTINGDAALEIEVTKAVADTTLARIVRMVAEAQAQRAASEQWVERFARVYTPAVFGLALAVLLVPPLLFGGVWSDWMYRSLVLLVIGCPCALVISTPVSVVAGLTAAARNGVLIKGGAYLEAPARLQAIALDKTGTLTGGQPRVVSVVSLDAHGEDGLIATAAALDSRSDHPLARAIVDEARRRGLVVPPVEGFQIVQGKGATGAIGRQRYWLGSHRFVEERCQETPDVHTRLEDMTRAGQSVVTVGDDTHVCGFIGLADAIRPESRDAVIALRAAGIAHVVMLTGDNRGTAEAIAGQAGIDEIRAELLPQDKVAAIEELTSRYGTVAMVGDGINDAPAMARATLGIAMGAAGSDAAIETADIALMSDDVGKLPWLIRHSRRTNTVIKQNISFALAVKALFVVLTFLGHASLWAAILADMGASLLVVFNGLRLLRSSVERSSQNIAVRLGTADS